MDNLDKATSNDPGENTSRLADTLPQGQLGNVTPPQQSRPDDNNSDRCCRRRHSRVSPISCCCGHDEHQSLSVNTALTDEQNFPAPHTPPGIAELLYADLVQSPPFGHNRPPPTPEGTRKNRLSRGKNSTFTRPHSLRKILVSPTTQKEKSPEKHETSSQQTGDDMTGTTTGGPRSQQLNHRGTRSPQQ